MTKNQILKYLKERELDIQNANASFLAADLVFSNYVNSQKVHGVNYGPVFSHFTFKVKDFYYFHQIIDAESIKKVNKKIYLEYLKSPQTLFSKINAHNLLTKELDDIWEEYEKKGGPEISNKELLNLLTRFVSIAREWWYYGSISEDKGEVINREIAPNFAKRNNIELARAQELLATLSHPEKPAAFSLERKDFLDICIDVLDGKNPDQKIKKYLKNYFWFDTDFYRRKEITKKSLLKKAARELKEKGRAGIIKELSDIAKGFDNISQEKKKILKKLQPSKEDKADILFSETIIKWVDDRKLGMMKHLYYLFCFLEDIAKRFGLEYSDLSFYSLDEKLELLRSGKKVSKRELRRRQRDVFLVFEKGQKMKMFYGKDADLMLKTATQKHSERELKGTVASKGKGGKIQGVVRIILNPSKEKFEEGKILVTSMTRVEFISLMRKAKAIITNEGGVACHAAIVSRELGLPCIIGTKNATKLLKDGDIVEMDLDKGVIDIKK